MRWNNVIVAEVTPWTPWAAAINGTGVDRLAESEIVTDSAFRAGRCKGCRW